MVVGPAPPLERARSASPPFVPPASSPGLLRSTTTQRDGFVNMVDVAPTILTYFGLDRPDAMEGRRMETGAPGGIYADHRALLVDANEDGLFRDTLVGPSMGVVMGVAIALAVLALVIDRGRAYAGGASSASWSFLALCAVRVPRRDLPGGSVPLRAARRRRRLLAVRDRRRRCSSPRVCMAGRRGGDPCSRAAGRPGQIVALHLVDLVTGAHLEWNTVFGYSPTIGIRFVGQGNMTFAQLTAAVGALRRAARRGRCPTRARDPRRDRRCSP